MEKARADAYEECARIAISNGPMTSPWHSTAMNIAAQIRAASPERATSMIDVAKARESARRLINVAFRKLDPDTGDPIRPRFSIPADEKRDDDLVLMAALDELEKLQKESKGG